MEELYRTEQCWLTWRWISLVLVLYSFSLHKREIRSNPWGEKQKQKGRNIKEQARHRLKRWKIHEGYNLFHSKRTLPRNSVAKWIFLFLELEMDRLYLVETVLPNGPDLETVLPNGSYFPYTRYGRYLETVLPNGPNTSLPSGPYLVETVLPRLLWLGRKFQGIKFLLVFSFHIFYIRTERSRKMSIGTEKSQSRFLQLYMRFLFIFNKEKELIPRIQELHSITYVHK